MLFCTPDPHTRKRETERAREAYLRGNERARERERGGERERERDSESGFCRGMLQGDAYLVGAIQGGRPHTRARARARAHTHTHTHTLFFLENTEGRGRKGERERKGGTETA